MILLRLFYEFAQIGLFAVGGGLATIPFLQDLGVRTGWFTAADLMAIVAVSESTPGPIGVNMATYVGYTCAGVPGAIVATLGLATPSIIVITIIARMLQQFRQSKTVDNVFYGLRPASTALIAAAGLAMGAKVLHIGVPEQLYAITLPLLGLAVALFLLIEWKKLKKVHPIVFIAAAAVIGIVFQL